jgi:hypothetical protein
MIAKSILIPLSHKAPKNLGKFFTVLLIMILFLSSASAVWAQWGVDTYYYPVDTSQIPQPSVPQFTVKLVDYSYDVPSKTVTTTDAYNGQITTTTTPGYHVKDYRLVVMIKNQPYTTKIGNWTFQLYYVFRMKGHYEEWSNSSYEFIGCSDLYGDTQYWSNNLLAASTKEYTVPLNNTVNYRVGDQIDFKVQAVIANTQTTWNYEHMFPIPDGTVFAYFASPWSQIQTFTMPDISNPNFNIDKPTTTQQTTNPTQSVPTQTTNPTTTQTENPTDQIGQVNTVLAIDNEKAVIITMGVLIVVLLVALIVSNKRKAGIRKPEVPV